MDLVHHTTWVTFFHFLGVMEGQIEDTLFEDIWSVRPGGAILLAWHNKTIPSSSDYYIPDNVTLTLSNVTFTQCVSTESGGAIFVYNGHLVANNCSFTNNQVINYTDIIPDVMSLCQGGHILDSPWKNPWLSDRFLKSLKSPWISMAILENPWKVLEFWK